MFSLTVNLSKNCPLLRVCHPLNKQESHSSQNHLTVNKQKEKKQKFVYFFRPVISQGGDNSTYT